ncbi:hypothetical protein [uncultured Cohaesibacter sp.]|uniref:hypothetical protein n=1 Tax=uncultured Cohaesibacter sp. TaxID=1002546 RepID=UPI002AABAC94|nr:hypothetical protein [uncultured Cohaesibacter sp.]
MSRFSFEKLAKIYDASSCPTEDGSAQLTIADSELLELVREIDNDLDLTDEIGISISSDTSSVTVGDCVDVKVGPPRPGFAKMYTNFDAFLRVPETKVKEPENYYIFENRISSGSDNDSERLQSYRLILRAIDILSQAATLFDATRRVLYFIGNTKVVVPIEYSVKDLDALDRKSLSSFIEEISETIHRDRKFTILLEELNSVLANVSEKDAFSFFLKNIKLIWDRVSRGYKLYISEFSYSKIRRQIENEKLDYLAKIHKTIVDIQGQMLGIPIASIVVASQLKSVSVCGTQYWSNLAVTAGVWFFLILLLIALANQFATLRDLKSNIVRQRDRLHKEYMEVSDQFEDIYTSLLNRERFHRLALLLIGMVGLSGAIIETVAYWKLTAVGFDACSGGMVQDVMDALNASSGDLKTL